MAIKNLSIEGKEYKVTTQKQENLFTLEINSRKIQAAVIDWNPQTRTLVFEIDGKLYRSQVTTKKNGKLVTLFNSPSGKSYELLTSEQKISKPKKFSSSTILLSPLAGRIIKSNVTQNQFVKKDQQLLVIESMKMENEIRAESDAFIKTISIAEGDLVQPDQELMTFEFEKGEKNEETQNR